ncbi:MAG: glutathione S-transferase family protein [Pseudomonadota bacterium]
MITLYDFHDSGNGYKIRLLLHLIARPYHYIEVDILNGASRTSDFLSRNASGRIPVVELADGTALTESNAILFHLAQGTSYWPKSPIKQAQVLSWLFFEQYSHEPFIATSRFIRKHRELDQTQRDALDAKREPGLAALSQIDAHLATDPWLVGNAPTIADIGLFAYTHVAPEGGFELSPFAHIGRWLERVRSLPGFIPITTTAGPAPA